MDTKTDILNELTSLSPLIAAINKRNIFTVPQGYFDSISATVLACLQVNPPVFNLPDNKQLPAVPEGYFDQLADSILNKIRATETAADEIRNLSPTLYDIQNKNVFEVPAGYFERINSSIIDKVNLPGTKEELREISPLLYSIQSKAPYEVPDGYFDHLPESVLKKVKPKTATIVNIGRRSVFIKYAVAAMVTGITGLGIYRYIDKPHPGVTVETRTTAGALDASIEKGKNMNDKQFDDALKNLNDADIVKYLENNGDITDVADLNNDLEDINLPSQEDYLLDETTLENYLREIDKTTLNN